MGKNERKRNLARSGPTMEADNRRRRPSHISGRRANSDEIDEAVAMSERIATCPICKGTGILELPHRHGDDERRAKQIMAQALHQNGYSLRQIMKLCGWKSVRSAALAVKSSELVP